MCRLADWLQSYHEKRTRSLRIGGHCTSIRLEKSFWETLEEIAAREEISLARLLTTLHNEVLDHHGEVKNFASLLRCACLVYRSGSAGLPGLHIERGNSTSASASRRLQSLDRIGEPSDSATVPADSAALLWTF
jgi:predicted DNA-binding ribbon-helix-helix protein